MTQIAQINALFDTYGGRTFDNSFVEPVNALEHALQCAELAESAGAHESLVAAALLHDIGELISASPLPRTADDMHELRAVAFLAADYGPDVVEPIRLHVQAKRYLVATDPCYRYGLSAAAYYSLSLQGGPMSSDEVWLFEALPYAKQAVLLRRWDDAAKDPGRTTAPLAHYLNLLERLSDHPLPDPRIVIGSFTAPSHPNATGARDFRGGKHPCVPLSMQGR